MSHNVSSQGHAMLDIMLCCVVILCWVMAWYLTVSPVLQIGVSFNKMECTVCRAYIHTYICGSLVRWLEGNGISSTDLYKSHGFVPIRCPLCWKRNHNHFSKLSCKKTLFEVSLNFSFNYNIMCPSRGNSSQQEI